MGLAATQMRFLALTARKSNIEYKGQQINQQRTVLSNNSANITQTLLSLNVPIPPSQADYTKLEANSDGKLQEVVDYDAFEDANEQYTYKKYLYEQEIQLINAKTEIAQQQDKRLELELNQIDTEQSAIKTELEALDKVIGDNVEDSYKTFGG